MPPEPGQERASAVAWRWRRGREEPHPAAGARRHGLLRGALGLAIAALLALWKPVLGAVAAALALSLLTLALVSPRGLYPRVEAALAAFAHAVAVAVSWTTLTLVHVLVFLPLGLFLRWARKLRLVRTLDRDAPTYWRAPDTAHRGSGSHGRQF